MSLYYCILVVSLLTYVDTFVVMDVPSGVMAVPVVTYVAYFLCAVMTSACISNFGVRTVVGSKIGAHTIVGRNSGLPRLYVQTSL